MIASWKGRRSLPLDECSDGNFEDLQTWKPLLKRGDSNRASLHRNNALLGFLRNTANFGEIDHSTVDQETNVSGFGPAQWQVKWSRIVRRGLMDCYSFVNPNTPHHRIRW